MTKDSVSRQAVIESIGSNININFEGQRGLEKYVEDVKLIMQCMLDEQIKRVEKLPSVVPTHETCKDCAHYDPLTCNSGTCLNPNMQWSNEVSAIHYCADFEKRGDKND